MGKAKKHKHIISANSKNTGLAVIAIVAVLILSLYFQLHFYLQSNKAYELNSGIFSGILIQGASVLKNRCETAPETYLVFGSNDNNVYALDADTGCIVWRFDDGDGDIKSSITAEGDDIFFGTTENKLFALSLADGTEKWSIDTNGKIFGAVASDGEYIYAGDNNGTVSAYNIDSGASEWSYNSHNVQEDIIYDVDDNETNKTIYAVDKFLHVGYVIALEPDTQEERWIFSAESEISAQPLVAEDGVYVPSNENILYKLNKAYGVAVWTFSTEQSIRSTPIMDDDGILYFGSNDGYFYAVNSSDGALVWKYPAGSEITAAAAVDDSLVYFGTLNNKLFALNKQTGLAEWSTTLGGKIYGGLKLYNDILFVPSADYSMYAFETASGKILWSYETRGALYGAATIVT